MCGKAIQENSGTLRYVTDCYKSQEIHNKAVENYSHALKYVFQCFETQNMCDKQSILFLRK